jgi:hypothetical protein
MIGDRTRTVIIWIITCVWVLNFILAWRVQDYQGSESVNAIFMAIITATFVSGSRRREEVERKVSEEKKKRRDSKESK